MFLKKSKILAIAFVMLMLVSCLVSCSQDNTPDGYKLVACEGDKFRFYVPQSWQASDRGGITSAVYAMDQNVTVSVYAADDAGELSAEEYWALCNEKLGAELKDYSWSEKTEKTVLGGKAAIKTVYSAKLTLLDHTTGKTSDVAYKYMQVMARHDSKMYVMLYSAPEELYDAHVEEMEGNADGVGMMPYFVFADAYHSDDNNKEFSSNVKAPDGMKLISTDERAYRFFVPEAWKVNLRTENTAAYIDETDGTRTNVSVQMYMTSDERQTVEQYWKLCSQSYGEIFAEFEVVSESKIEMDGVAAGRYVYDVTSGGKQYRQLQAIVKKGPMFYVVTYTASPENFESHTADVDKMIESFDLR